VGDATDPLADEVLDRITGARDLVKRVHEVITDSPRRSDK
jgi:hypothetical protein